MGDTLGTNHKTLRVGVCLLLSVFVASADDLPRLMELAEKGDAEAQYQLSLHYAENEPRDLAKMLEWVRKAAEQGHVEAQFALSSMYAWGPEDILEIDIVEAVKWSEKAAEQGHAKSQRNMGMFYAHGNGVERDYVKAREWFRKAAAQGDEGAEARVKTLNDMIAWADPAQHVDAAERGDAEAQFHLAVCLARAAPPDFDKSAEWLAKAAAQKHARAQYALGFYQTVGNGVPKDEVKGFELIQQAADQGLAEAWQGLYWCYRNGVGVEIDLVKAHECHVKAAELGDMEAQYFLGRRYEKGEGISKDLNEAAKWYRKALAQDHYEAGDHLRGLELRGLVPTQGEKNAPEK